MKFKELPFDLWQILTAFNCSLQKAHIPNAPLEIKTDDTDDSQFLHHLAIACHALSDCVKDCNDLKRNIDEHDFSVEQKATELFDRYVHLKE